MAVVLERIDPRLADSVRLEVEVALQSPAREAPPSARGVVLAGHRAAGKTALLPAVASSLNRPQVDLDEAIQSSLGEPIRSLFARDPNEFRRRERTCFEAIPEGRVIAVGGGFLALHGDLLEEYLVVVVPVSWETYRERLLTDRSRPRLRPDLSLEAELAHVFEERTNAHASVRHWSLAHFLACYPLPAEVTPS